MLTKVRVEGRTIRIAMASGTERTVTFPSPIAQLVGFAQAVAVRLEPDPYILKDRNVFGVTDNTASVWRVDSVIAGAVCTSLAAAGERLVAALDDGREVAVDPMTGRLL